MERVESLQLNKYYDAKEIHYNFEVAKPLVNYKLRADNIFEYLLYMWQVVTWFKLDCLSSKERNIVSAYISVLNRCNDVRKLGVDCITQ